eukprot:7094497-Prymnesium_polylepis.1
MHARDHPRALCAARQRRIAAARSRDTRGLLHGAQDIHASVLGLRVLGLQRVDVDRLPKLELRDDTGDVAVAVRSSDELTRCLQTL